MFKQALYSDKNGTLHLELIITERTEYCTTAAREQMKYSDDIMPL